MAKEAEALPCGIPVWRNTQWEVTERGLYAPQTDYFIEASRLGETRSHLRKNGLAVSDWLLHMAEKNWVNIEDFISAWCVAVAIHRSPTGGMDVITSIMKARSEKFASEEWDRAHPPGKWHYHGQL